MGHQDDGIKIRTLPRKNEKVVEASGSSNGPSKSSAKSTEKSGPQTAPTPRWIIYLGTSSALLLGGLLLTSTPKSTTSQQASKPASTSVKAAQSAKVAAAKAVHSQDLSSLSPEQANDLVTRHLQDSQVRREMMVKASEIENMKMQTADLQADPYALDLSGTTGVHLEQQENTAERVYEDLNANTKSYGEQTPDEKISARLANRKWVNELERRERVTYVRNFILSAYERGYDVQIDADLKVVGVKKVNRTKKFTVDQAIDKIASKQGF